MKNRLRATVVGVLISTVVTAGILEGAIRVFRLTHDYVPIPYRQVAGEEDFAPEPNASVRGLFGVLYRTDSHGLRGPERSFARDSTHARVALLGDSVVWGLGVAGETTIPAWLERLAESRGLALEAWNLGVQANNTFNEKARYARFAPLIRPDVTIVVVLFNDLEPVAAHFRVTSAGTLSNPGRRAPYPDSWRPALEQSALFHALIQIYRAVREEDETSSLSYLPDVLTQLDQIRAIAGEVGSALIVAAMPGIWPDTNRFAGLSNGLRQFSADREIAFVDLSLVLGRPVRREYFLPSDSTHPTAEGARLIAEALLPKVDEALKRR